MGDDRSSDPGLRDLSHQAQAVPILLVAPSGQLVHLDHLSVDVGSSDKEDRVVGQCGHSEVGYGDGEGRGGGHLVAVVDSCGGQGVGDDVESRVVAVGGGCRTERGKYVSGDV
jgi:hypothetical protein